MNTEHAKTILEELSKWYEFAYGGPTVDDLMSDGRTFQEHILAALMGQSFNR